MKYPIVEIFESIQGEGDWLGKPVTFIRTGGCNLSCPWCDTNFNSFTEMEIATIVEKVKDRNIVITGGEPLIHDLVPLLKSIWDSSDSEPLIAIETNATLSTREIEPYVSWITASPKPQSNWILHPDCYPHELKYIVDGLFSPTVISPSLRKEYAGKIWLQPESNNMQQRWKEAYNYAMKYPELRVGVQLHRLIEGVR